MRREPTTTRVCELGFYCDHDAVPEPFQALSEEKRAEFALCPQHAERVDAKMGRERWR